MEATAGAGLSLLVLAAATAISLTGRAAAQQASGVVATYNQYNPAQVDWDLGAAGAFRATWDAGMLLAWRQQYGWTAFCGPAGAHGEPSCGRCLLAVARVVDQCHNGGLDMDVAVFTQIDTDGGGMANGSLMIDYEFVHC